MPTARSTPSTRARRSRSSRRRFPARPRTARSTATGSAPGSSATSRRWRGSRRIVHPLVKREEERFLSEAQAAGRRIVLLDIPLLFETRAEGEVDAVVVVSAPAEVQRERMLKRPGMTPERLEAMLARQVPDAEKRRRAHFVIDTGGTLDATRAQVDEILRAVAGMASAF